MVRHQSGDAVRITTANRSSADDIAARQRRYLLAMGFRTVCFVAAIFVCAQAIRMRLEELALVAEFPEYAAYAAATPRILPLPSRPRRLGPIAIGRGR